MASLIGDGVAKLNIGTSTSSTNTNANSTSNAFEPGDAVAIEGLVGATQHNGRVGYVVKFQTAKERYAVRLGPSVDSADGVLLALKPTNLTLASSPPPCSNEDATPRSSGGSGNKDNGALLRTAAAKGLVGEVLRFALVGAGLADSVDTYGESAVHQAAANGHAPMVALLVNKLKCDPHRRATDGATPLHVVSAFALLCLLPMCEHLPALLYDPALRSILLDDVSTDLQFIFSLRRPQAATARS
jgi:ankyrin repeat protein